MGKLENEVKILDILQDSLKDSDFEYFKANKKPDEIKRIENRLNELGGNKKFDGFQKIYVYDMPAIYTRYIDCLGLINGATSDYQYDVARSKFNGVLNELDNLTTAVEQQELNRKHGTPYLVDLLNKTDNEHLKTVFSLSDITDIVKKYKVNPNKWVRLRQTGDETTITVKHILNPNVKNDNNSNMQRVLETETPVESLEAGNDMLNQLGFTYRNYQEKYRIKYNLDGAEVDIDFWPMIPPYMEIEDDSNDKIDKLTRELGLENHKIVSCNTDDVYNHYGLNIYDYRELTFNTKKLQDKKLEKDINK